MIMVIMMKLKNASPCQLHDVDDIYDYYDGGHYYDDNEDDNDYDNDDSDDDTEQALS